MRALKENAIVFLESATNQLIICSYLSSLSQSGSDVTLTTSDQLADLEPGYIPSMVGHVSESSEAILIGVKRHDG
jgi:hypothetical protein